MAKRRGSEIAYHAAIAGGSYFAERPDAPARIYSDAWKDREHERLAKIGMEHLAPKENAATGREITAGLEAAREKSEREAREKAAKLRVDRAMSDMAFQKHRLKP